MVGVVNEQVIHSLHGSRKKKNTQLNNSTNANLV